MAGLPFPSSADGYRQWARDNNVPEPEARHRYASIVVACTLGMNQPIGAALAFKGGNALRFAYGSPRSTLDLDYTARSNAIPDDEQQLRNLLDRALKGAESNFGIKTRCQSIRRNPSNPAATHPTYEIHVGYQFPGDRHYHNFEDRNLPTVIALEISLNDLVCEAPAWQPDLPQAGTVCACSHEDILAEKLRSLLQQPIRKRHRCQDVFDLAYAWRHHRHQLDFHKLLLYFQQKCAIRQIFPSRESFNETVRAMAHVDYEQRMREQTGDAYIPFDEAWDDVKTFVQSLAWPDG